MTTTELSIADQFCRAFLTPSERGRATHELAAHGQDAIPILRSILNGDAKNQYGVAYRSLGMPVDCALVTISLVGLAARPLEDLVRVEIAAGHPYAEPALRAITGAFEETSPLSGLSRESEAEC